MFTADAMADAVGNRDQLTGRLQIAVPGEERVGVHAVNLHRNPGRRSS